jgi:chemotaxis-related protein WspD
LLAGIVNIRGELALCVHLPRLLGIHANGERIGTAMAPALPSQPSERFLVVRRESERWVLPVDEVDLVHRVAHAELAEAPATLRLLDADRLFGALRTKLR